MSGAGTGTYVGTGTGTGVSGSKTLIHQMLEDLDVFFDPAGGFAKNATYTPTGGAAKTVNVIFDDEYSGSSPIGIEIEATGPQALAKTTDVADVAAGDLLVVGGVTYYVINKRLNPPDGGPGTTLLILSTEWHN